MRILKKLTDRTVMHRLCKTFRDCYKVRNPQIRRGSFTSVRDVSRLLRLVYRSIIRYRRVAVYVYSVKNKISVTAHCCARARAHACTHAHTQNTHTDATLLRIYEPLIGFVNHGEKNPGFEFIAYNVAARSALVAIKNQRYLSRSIIYRIILLLLMLLDPRVTIRAFLS